MPALTCVITNPEWAFAHGAERPTRKVCQATGLTYRQAISWVVPFFEGGVWGCEGTKGKQAPEGEVETNGGEWAWCLPLLGSQGAMPAGCLGPGLLAPGDGERSPEVGSGAQVELWTPAHPLQLWGAQVRLPRWGQSHIWDGGAGALYPQLALESGQPGSLALDEGRQASQRIPQGPHVPGQA